MYGTMQVVAGLMISGMVVILLFAIYQVIRHLARQAGPLESVGARLLQKSITCDMDGGYPSEYYHVTFQLEDGRWESFRVTPDVFERLAEEGTEGVLHFQGLIFKGFNARSA